MGTPSPPRPCPADLIVPRDTRGIGSEQVPGRPQIVHHDVEVARLEFQERAALVVWVVHALDPAGLDQLVHMAQRGAEGNLRSGACARSRDALALQSRDDQIEQDTPGGFADQVFAHIVGATLPAFEELCAEFLKVRE